MTTATYFLDIGLDYSVSQFRIDLFSEKTVISGVIEKDFFHEGQFSRIKGANFLVVTGKVNHFIKTDEIEIAVTNKSLDTLKPLYSRLE